MYKRIFKEGSTSFYIYHATNDKGYKQIIKDGILKTSHGDISFYPYISHYGKHQFKIDISKFNRNDILDLIDLTYETWYFEDWEEDLKTSKLKRKFKDIVNESDIIDTIMLLNKNELLYLIGEFGLEVTLDEDILLSKLQYEYIK